MKTYKELGYLPDMLIANDAGFADTEFIKTLGKDAEYVISREVWALDIGDQESADQAGQRRCSRPLQDQLHRQLRAHFTGLMVLADAINRAGSTDARGDPQGAGRHQHPGITLIMPWKGVKFDETGQNTLGAGILVQVHGGKYATVWPFDLASQDVVWPMPKWEAIASRTSSSRHVSPTTVARTRVRGSRTMTPRMTSIPCRPPRSCCRRCFRAS